MIPAIGSALPRFDSPAVGNGFSIGGTGAAGASAGTPAADFGAVLSQIAAESVNTMKAAEAVSIQGIQGKASTAGFRARSGPMHEGPPQ